MGPRRRAREAALQILYQLEVQPQLGEEQALTLFFRNFETEEENELRGFAAELVKGVRSRQGEIDELIGRASRNWRLERMARVDRNLLRLGVYELRHAADVPPRVAINEAIEIAKRFGTAESPAFVNGILDRCLEELEPGGKPGGV